ncbi:MAG TPA: MFS transporter [Xanthobacteraceae bacterium]|nr:MFS transporter [Xanthobacteraceae bacterium]
MEYDLSHSPVRRATALVLLWLAGACLRLTVLAMPPVVPLLHADLHLSETGVGWLASLPPLLFAIAAVPGALLIARFGIVPALVVGLLLNAFGSAARGLLPNAAALYASTIVMAAGVSIMQPALPPLVRAWFPARIGFATAIYTTGLLVGEILAAALTIPLILPLVHDSWRLNFVVWSIPVLITALLVAIYAPKLGGAKTSTSSAGPSAGRRWWPDWRRPLIWKLGLILGSVNATYFVTNAFLPDYMTAQGRPDLISTTLTAINLGQLPAAFLMLGIAGRLVTRPWAYAAMGALSLACLIGMLTMHGLWIVFWVGVLGFTGALVLILALALPSVLSSPDDVHRTSAGMFTISYSVAMAMSVIGGWLWDLTHSPVIGFIPVAICGLTVIVLAPTVSQADRHFRAANSETDERRQQAH